MNHSKEKFTISKDQIRDIYGTLKDLSDSYKEKDANMSDAGWLTEQYKSFFPSLSDQEAEELGAATINGVRRFDTALKEAMEAASAGKSKEQWFSEKMAGEIKGIDINEAGECIHALDSALLSGNQHLMDQEPIQIQNEGISVSLPESQDAVRTVEDNDRQWNTFTVKETLSHLGQSAALVGLQTMNHPESLSFAADSVDDLADSSGALKELIENGDIEQVKTLLTAALKIGADSNKLPFLSKAASVDTIAGVASHGVEYISTLSKFSDGKITMMQAMEHMGLSGVSLLYNLCSVEGIRSVSTALLSQIPIVGPVLGNVVGGLISVALGTEFHEKVKQTVQKVETKVRTVVNNAWNTIKSVGQKIKNKVKNFCSWLFS